MRKFDVAQHLITEHSMCPVFGGSRDYPSLFLEYMEYGTFNFIPWILTDVYFKQDVGRVVEMAVSTEIMEADGVKEAEKRTGRNVVHAFLLCTSYKVLEYFKDKRPDFVQVYTCMYML